jgi:precorrin-4 C11-methyltransferase
MPGHVYFIGAGPGDPALCTLRGRDLIASADLVIYADSLVPAAVAAWARPDARVVGSSSLTLADVVALMLAAVARGESVARVHSGDPSLYGALGEQLAALREAGVPSTVVPGVSSAFAAAAALGCELTLPGVAQTVVLTRVARRTRSAGAPLRAYAHPGATVVLFLSLTTVEEAVEELREAGWADATPAAVAHRVGWEDQRLIRTTLGAVAAEVRVAGLTRQGLVLVGPALDPEPPVVRSRLYAEDFAHLFRRRRDS